MVSYIFNWMRGCDWTIYKSENKMRDETVIKPIGEFVKQYRNDGALLISYPKATHYSVDERGNLVLYENDEIIVFINSLNKDINF